MEEFDGDALAAMLGRPGVAEALVGCHLYRNDPDAAERIVACDPVSGRAIVGKQGRQVAIRGSYVLSGDGRLRVAVDGATTTADRTLAADLRQIATFGLVGRCEPDDAARLAAAIRAIGRDELENEPDRRRAATLALKYGTPRTLLRFTDQWLRLSAGRVLPDVLIAHVKALRDLGEAGPALAATEVVTAKDHGLARTAEAVLLTQRAALWLDLAERRGDGELLVRAREAAGRAWGLARSEELDGVYGRLRKLEEELDTHARIAGTRRADERLRDARDVWDPKPGRRPGR